MSETAQLVWAVLLAAVAASFATATIPSRTTLVMGAQAGALWIATVMLLREALARIDAGVGGETDV